MRTAVVPLALMIVCASCSGKPLPLDVALPAGEARAGKVSRPEELIGGPVAYGQAGQVWKLYNARARFLIQDVGTSVGLDLYGGNLIDADLVRPGDDGKNGNDLFRETFPVVGLRVLKPERVEVVSDGTRGGPAQLRVIGTDAASMILPQIDSGAELGGQITLDYILEPDSTALKLVTTYTAPPDQGHDALLLGDFLSFGASLSLLSPENGFRDDPATVSFLCGVGAGTSYGYVAPEGPLRIPLVDASGTVTLLKTVSVPPGGSAQVARYLVLGGGDAASVTAPMYGLRGIATEALSGTVRDAAGAPVAARVTLFSAPLDDKAHAVDQAQAGADGGFQLRAPPGSYVLVASSVGRLRGAPVPVTLPAAGPVDVRAGAAGQARLDIGEINSKGVRGRVPAKVSFLGIDVEAPDPRLGPDPTESERNGVHAVALSADGTGVMRLKPGAYQVVVSRGVEYELVRLPRVEVPKDGEVTVAADLVRVVDTAGWLAGDYHQHSQGSIDSPVPVGERVVEDLAEGVEFPASTEHDNIQDFRPHIARLGAGQWMNAVPGDEISVNGVGHFNAYPLRVDPQRPYDKIGAKLWAGQEVAQMVTKLRQGEPEPVVVHISHPRTKSLSGYFNSVRFDPTTGTSDAPLDGFEAIEVNGDLGSPKDYLPENDAVIHQKAGGAGAPGIPTMRDWFGMLNLGRSVCALGNSDTHQRNGGTGYPRSFVKLGTDDPQQATGAGLVAAIRAGQVSVSAGPFVTVKVNGKEALGRGQVVSLGGAGAADLQVRVQAPSWIGVSGLEVYGNGRPLWLRKDGAGVYQQVAADAAGAVLTAPIDAKDGRGAVRLDGVVKVTPTRDTWYVVVVRGSGTLLPVAGVTPYGYTNPVYVDREGDGWTAPGL